MDESTRRIRQTRWRVKPPSPPLPAPDQLPPGLELPDGRILVFAPHRECPCTDCHDAFAAFEAGTLREALDWNGEWLP